MGGKAERRSSKRAGTWLRGLKGRCIGERLRNESCSGVTGMGTVCSIPDPICPFPLSAGAEERPAHTGLGTDFGQTLSS